MITEQTQGCFGTPNYSTKLQAGLVKFVRTSQERREELIKRYCCAVCGGLQKAKIEDTLRISAVMQNYIDKENFGHCECRAAQEKLEELPLAVVVGRGEQARLYVKEFTDYLDIETGKCLLKIPNKTTTAVHLQIQKAIEVLNILLEYWGGFRFYYIIEPKELEAVKAGFKPYSKIVKRNRQKVNITLKCF
jgi:hypothetical protein